MKLVLSVLSFLAASPVCRALCSGMVEHPLGSETKLSFAGFDPSVTRITGSGVGNKIILRGYEREPVVTMSEDTLVVTAGELCDPGAAPPTPVTISSATRKFIGFGLPFLGSTKFGGFGTAALALGFLMASPASVSAQSASDCQVIPIEVEIYVDATIEEIVNKQYKAGDYEACPRETQYWEHQPEVFGGYTGCVAERGLYPCVNDATDISREDGAFYESGPYVWDTENDVCMPTGNTIEDQLFVIRGGNPMDKFEIVSRTGMSPVVVLPFTRMPYPSYRRGVNVEDDPQSEDNNARVTIKKMMEYIDAWTYDELADWDVTITEGAEQGKALEIARTTCNRDIYVFLEAPAYGYSLTTAADVANMFSSSFYNGEECLCFNTTSCNDKNVEINYVGWFPTTPYPERMGGDGLMYSAISDSPNSPWFETLVFPENPSGVFKTPRHPNVNRRVCDGVYLWPMYMGGRDWKIPKDELPDCSAWGFSISKIYSAAARAGWMMYREEPATNHDAMVDAIGTTYSLHAGSLSQWTWQGQMQLMETFMSKPYTDPTSWIGAYGEILKEKYDYLIEGFENCPPVLLSNPYSGAYAWFVLQPPYLGIQEGDSSPSFFRNVLGVSAFGYTWGFRGADPADFYGEGYTVNDFTRVNMYRDIMVYKELGRRAKIICSDLDATVGDGLLSVNQWAAAGSASRRRRLHEGGYDSPEDHKRHLKEVVPDLTNAQIEDFVSSQIAREKDDAAIASCAPEYSTSCIFDVLGPDRDAIV